MNPLLKIVLATDGSASALQAADWIALHWTPEQVHLSVVTVQHENLPPLTEMEAASPKTYQAMIVATYEHAHEHAQQAITETVAHLPTFPVETHILSGAPVASILQYLQLHPADLVVLGRRGHTALQNLVMGSISQGVLQRAPVPVLICPPVPRH